MKFNLVLILLVFGNLYCSEIDRSAEVVKFCDESESDYDKDKFVSALTMQKNKLRNKELAGVIDLIIDNVKKNKIDKALEAINEIEVAGYKERDIKIISTLEQMLSFLSEIYNK